jgi:hypothetical protein
MSAVLAVFAPAVFALLSGVAAPAWPVLSAGFPGGRVRPGLPGLAVGPGLAGLAARAAATAASARATSSGCGRDTSLARMAVSIPIFIAGITAS